MRDRAPDWSVRRRGAQAVAVTVAVVISAMIAWPRAASVLPACPLYERFGVLCPGCGGTRAMLALLHGHLLDAFRFNALLVTLLPLALWFAGESYRRAISNRRFQWPEVPPATTYGLLIAAGLFGVFRNLG